MTASAAELAMAWHFHVAGVPAPVTEHRFDPARRWRFDFAWPEWRVACEVEGGTWTDGRHTRGQGFERDAVKYCEAAIAGWLVLRVTPAMVNDGRALALVERALAARERTAA